MKSKNNITDKNKLLKLKLNKVLLDTQIQNKGPELIKILKSDWRRDSSDVTSTFAKVMLDWHFSEEYADTIITKVASQMNTGEFYTKNGVDSHRVIIEIEYNNYY